MVSAQRGVLPLITLDTCVGSILLPVACELGSAFSTRGVCSAQSWQRLLTEQAPPAAVEHTAAIARSALGVQPQPTKSSIEKCGTARRREREQMVRLKQRGLSRKRLAVATRRPLLIMQRTRDVGQISSASSSRGTNGPCEISP